MGITKPQCTIQPPSTALLQELETRLDNIVYRLGYARSIRGARQLVVHRHVTVNNEIVDRPSYRVGVGSLIQLTDKARAFHAVNDSLNSKRITPSYLVFDPVVAAGSVSRLPQPCDLSVSIDTTMIVAYYSHN